MRKRKFLGIDYGAKYVGLAISDESGALAFPMVVLKNTKRLLGEIAEICEEEEIEGIVLGESRDFSGKENPVQEEIELFKKELEKEIKIPVHFEPEFWTSAQVRRMGGSSGSGRGGHNDASAAAIILQSWLEKKASGGLKK